MLMSQIKPRSKPRNILTMCRIKKFLVLYPTFKVMLTCWNEKPDKRPPMSTLQQDLDDFGPALVENKYDYSYSEYMKREGLTNVVPGKGSSRGRNKEQRKQSSREEIKGKRVRRKRET